MERSLDKRFGLHFDLETPACVILEIAWSLGIDADEQKLNMNEVYRTSVLITINKTDAYTARYPFCNDLGHIALFLNPDDNIEWDEPLLLKSFEYTWALQNDINKIDTYTYGYPTPMRVKSASSVYIYRYLIAQGIRTRYDLKENDLIDLLNGFNYKQDYLYTNVCAFLALSDKATLISLYATLKGSTKRQKLNTKLLEEAFERNEYYSQPKSNEEAVVLAAKLFRKDISSFPVPILAYCELINGQFTTSDYERALLRVNDCIYDLSERFNPVFPIQIYLESELKQMCDAIGRMKYTRVKRNYESLAAYYLEDHFHSGIIPGVPLETSIQNENITECDVKNIVTYGSYGSSFTAYTVEELIYMFESNNYFYNPSGGIYGKGAIQSLELIAKRLKHRKLWDQLFTLIGLLKQRTGNLNFCKKTFQSYYDSLDCNGKLLVESRLRMIMKLGLTFRGWKEGDVWPIRKAPSYDTDEVVVTAAILLKKFLDSLDLEDQIDKEVLSLPLIKVEPKTHVLMINNDPEDGLTLMERLEIIKENKKGASCIRTSSSYLLATAYTFLDALQLPIQQEKDFQRIKITL